VSKRSFLSVASEAGSQTPDRCSHDFDFSDRKQNLHPHLGLDPASILEVQILLWDDFM
jgi:hypothetical protein